MPSALRLFPPHIILDHVLFLHCGDSTDHIQEFNRPRFRTCTLGRTQRHGGQIVAPPPCEHDSPMQHQNQPCTTPRPNPRLPLHVPGKAFPEQRPRPGNPFSRPLREASRAPKGQVVPPAVVATTPFA